MLPKSFLEMQQMFQSLPGVGKKTAERYTYYMLTRGESDVKHLKMTLDEFYNNITTCKICNIMTDKEVCPVCSDESREDSLLCVVENSKDAYAIEATRQYEGKYFILGGAISPSKGIMPENLKIDELKELAKNKKEIIIATNPTIDGEITSAYLAKVLYNDNIIISKLAQGIPIGGHVEYADQITLSRSIKQRIKM